MKKIIFIAMFLLIITACTNTEQNQQKTTTETSSEISQSFQKGVTMTYGADFNAFFDKALQAGTIITWAGDWNELSIQDSAPHVLATLAESKKYTPIIEAQFFTQSSGKLLRELNDETKQQYKDSAVVFVEKYNPEYIAFGIEINLLYETSPEDFAEFVQLYNEVYSAIKETSPNTNVFTIFQLEYMKKNNGWDLLNELNTDLAVFTTYPFILYNSPADIPENYYQEIAAHTTKPIAFTEIGWQDANTEFITLYFEQIKPLNPEFAVWSFLYDQNVQEPFDTMGLLDSNGNPKQAWSVWINA
jgi:hypothetical protein